MVYDGAVAGQNILLCDGTGSGGQGWYDLITADPSDAAVVFLGGVNTWKLMKAQAGRKRSPSNMWAGNSCGSPVVWWRHFLAFQNGTSTLFECNDGRRAL